MYTEAWSKKVLCCLVGSELNSMANLSYKLLWSGAGISSSSEILCDTGSENRC
jgi:hypothetical protein